MAPPPKHTRRTEEQKEEASAAAAFGRDGRTSHQGERGLADTSADAQAAPSFPWHPLPRLQGLTAQPEVAADEVERNLYSTIAPGTAFEFIKPLILLLVLSICVDRRFCFSKSIMSN